ncbi:cytochrome c biogenesis CcdA family protein [Pseudonocardia sp. KRD291]|uniref:cytochrome c biogenesis CcdA family protein n=1 Tax=Pseudonocardia sp. KRD291 TaxID=2792007 RepID=UPI001C4A3252|nr:cytochrome c biogenesis protein CcdA [Pseudonocardia sp. KRD291]MBW0104177.1 cytochrome C biogenesis protein [Pseudonocardia sp. KRD291]
MELVALASLALVAGVVSFSSPCVLPLLPGYISYVSGLGGRTGAAGGPVTAAPDRRQIRLGTALFVAGFVMVFTALGATASALGLLLRQYLPIITVVGGGVVIVLGLFQMGLLRIPRLARQVRVDMSRIGTGPAGAFPLGVAFAFSWTPCVGPVLATVLATAATGADPGRGIVLLLAYSAGLGLPFLLLGAGVARGTDRFGMLRRHARHVEIVGGLALVATGLLMITGGWTVLMSQVLAVYARLGWPPI